jgi:uncharacterized protein YjbI with pentapeptide repeats
MVAIERFDTVRQLVLRLKEMKARNEASVQDQTEKDQAHLQMQQLVAAGDFDALDALTQRLEELSQQVVSRRQLLAEDVPVEIPSLMEMKAGGSTAAQLQRGGGFTAAELKNGGFTAAELKDGGCFTAKELLESGCFTPAELKEVGFTAAELKHAGFTAAELKNGGFTAAELKETGLTAAELKEAGLTAADLSGGFTAAQLQEAGYDVAEMRRSLAFSPRELQQVGYALPQELGGRGQWPAWEELVGMGWSEAEIEQAGYGAGMDSVIVWQIQATGANLSSGCLEGEEGRRSRAGGCPCSGYCIAQAATAGAAPPSTACATTRAPLSQSCGARRVTSSVGTRARGGPRAAGPRPPPETRRSCLRWSTRRG